MMEYGRRFRIRVFGSSHGPEVGVMIEGVPERTPIDIHRIAAELARRRPVGRRLSTRRREEDLPVFDRGIRDGRATGRSIRIHVRNEDVRRGPYEELRFRPRPGHADYPARIRFGPGADLSGGGVFSGRMTVGIVAAGSIARQMLAPLGIEIAGFTSSIGRVTNARGGSGSMASLRRARDSNEVGAIHPGTAARMEGEIAAARRSGDSVGGTITARIDGLPVGLGEPFFGSLESEIAHLVFSIPGVKGIEFGAGFGGSRWRGSRHNDPFYFDRAGRVSTRTNHAGGILGGLATGRPVRFRVAVKPTSSIARPQETVDLISRKSATIVVKGRHDPCIVPRAVVVVEACAAIAVVDLAMLGGFLP